MKQLGIQVLFVDSNPDPHEFNSVQPNLQMMVETAIDYFVQAGYQKIGFIGGNPGTARKVGMFCATRERAVLKVGRANLTFQSGACFYR